jgi:hypothetical protein
MRVDFGYFFISLLIVQMKQKKNWTKLMKSLLSLSPAEKSWRLGDEFGIEPHAFLRVLQKKIRSKSVWMRFNIPSPHGAYAVYGWGVFFHPALGVLANGWCV